MLKRIGASIKNMLSGQGTGVDMAGSTGYCPREELSPSDIEDLMRVPMVRNVAECVPDDILRAWRIFDDTNKDKFFDIERKYNLSEVVHEALVMSKMYGGCVVLPQYVGTVDVLQTPRLSNEKIMGFKCIPQHLVHTGQTKDCYQVTFEHAPVQVHKSRVYLLVGKKRYDYTTNFMSGKGLRLGQSEIDLVAESFFNMAASDQQLSHLMAKAIVDVRKQAGLTQDADRASRSPQLAAQFSAKQAYIAEAASYASNQQAVICDKDNEDVVRLSVANGLGELVKISERYTDLFVAATTYPRTKVLGEQVAGLNNNGGADLRRYYDRVEHYRSQKVWDLLRWMDSHIETSENIKIPKWTFGNLWQMTETEQIDYQIKVADRDAKYYDILGDAVLEPIIEGLKKANTYQGLDFSASDVGNEQKN